MKRLVTTVLLANSAVASGSPGSSPPNVKLREWERGIAVESREQTGMAMYLWFYEWNMFDAVEPGQHTHGDFNRFSKQVSPDEDEASLTGEGMRLRMRAVEDPVHPPPLA